MSSRGRGGFGRGGGGGRGGSSGRYGPGGGRGRPDEGPPAEICEIGVFVHDAEGELLCRLTHAMIPYFNAGIYLENKARIGKVEEILGPINKVFFSVKPDHGIQPSSFKANDKFFIGTDKLLPLSRFTNESKGRGGGGRGAPGRGRGPPGRGFSGGRGPPGRGRGPPGGRGGSFSRGGGGGFSRGGAAGGFGRGRGRG